VEFRPRQAVAAIAAQPSPVDRPPMVVAIVALGTLRSDKYVVDSRVVDSDYRCCGLR
jgi:hypothetical protein